jgi:hypothetical protein
VSSGTKVSVDWGTVLGDEVNREVVATSPVISILADLEV